jgi:hypothetical protein
MENVDFELVPTKEPQVDFDLVPTKDSTTIQSVTKPSKPSTWDIIKQGFGESATGLVSRALSGEEGYTQPQYKPEGFGQELLGAGATLVGDIPAFAASALPAALAIPATWGGSATAIPATSMAGTEAFKAYMRGESPTDIAKRGGVGGAIGGVMGALGPIAKLPGVNKFLQKTAFPLQVGGGEAVGAGLEGRDVTPEGLAITGLTLGGLHAGTSGAKLVKKAIEAGPKAEQLATRQAAAEKAGIPATATTGGAVQPTIKPDILSTTTAASTVAKRRRKLVDDIQKKQEDLTKFQDMIKKKQEETTKVIIDDEVPVEAKLDLDQKKTIEDNVSALGDAEKVRELYKGDDSVSIYARELAAKRFNKGGIENGQVQTETEVKSETPSVQKLNKGKLSEEEFKALEDTNVFAPEELEGIKKLPGFKQREQYNRMFPEEVEAKPYTSEELTKAQDLASKVEAAAKARYSTLGKSPKPNPNKEQVKSFDEVEQELAALRKDMEGLTPDKITPEMEARMVSLMEKVGNELPFDEVVEPTERFRKAMELDSEEPSIELENYVNRRKLIREKLDLASEQGKIKRRSIYSKSKIRLEEALKEVEDEHITNEDLSPITDIGTKPTRTRAQEIKADRDAKEGSAEDWEAKLEAEGMPAELSFKREKVLKDYVEFLSSDRWNKEIHADSVKAKIDVEKELYNARNRLDSISEDKARYLLSRVYQHMPLTKAEAVEWFKTVEKVEAIADSKIRDRRMAFSRKAIASHYKGKPNHARIANTIIDTLKKQPTFELKVDPKLKGVGGFYSLVDNLVTIKSPKSLAHEIAHWAFDNVLTSADRAIYRQHFLDKFYDAEGNINPEAIKIDTTDRFNAVRSPAEAFAAKMADYTYDKVLTPAEKTLFAKVAEWFRIVRDNLLKRTTNDYSGVSELFDKVLSKDERTGWNILEGEPDYIRRANRDIVDSNYAKENSTFDMLGFQQMYERITELGKTFKKAKMDDKGRRILGEIKGNDWGLAEEVNNQTIFGLDNAPISERLHRSLGPYIISPVPFVKGTRNERHVYNANLAEMYIGHKFDQHRTTIDSIKLALKKGIGDPNNVRKVIEGKIEGTPDEIQAATEVRQWLDGMKERYKVYMLNEYKDNLSKREYNVLLDIISGSDIKDVKVRHPKLDTETIESIANKYKEIDTWGIDNYIPNVEAGRFKIITDGITEDGKTYKKLVAVGLSEKDAIRKATKYAEENPDVKELFIDTDYKIISDDKTKVTRGQYFGMMNSLAKKMTESIDGIDKGVAKNLASATMKRKFKIIPTDSYSPFLEPRRDILKGEEDIFPVLKSYAHSIEKKMALDPVIDSIRDDIPKMNKYEKEYILDYIEDVKGKYSKADKVVDDIFNTYRGYSRLVSRARTLEANLKLGYRPIAAGINLASGQMHSWVKRGLPIYTEGVKFLNTPEGRKFVEDIEPFLGTSIIDTGIDITSKTPVWKPLGLFQKPEPLNREVSAAAAYVQGLKEGMTPEAAQIFAIRANWAEQFTYNIANLPKIMRGPTGKLLTQFKPYLVKELEFMSSLSGKEWARYLGMQLALGGPKAYMTVVKSLPILAAFGFWEEAVDTAEEWMNKNIPLASRGVGGLPGLVDPKYAFDMSAAASFQFPAGPMDFAGPAISDLVNIKNNVLEPLFTYGPYAEDMKKTGDIAPIIRHWARLMKFTFTDDNWIKDTKGNKLYEVKDIVPFYLQSIAGVESVDISRIRAEERILAQRDVRTRGLVTRIINEAMKHVMDGTTMPPDLVQRMGKYNITGDTLKRRIKSSNLPPDLRIMLNTEVIRRPEVIEQFPNSQDYELSE